MRQHSGPPLAKKKGREKKKRHAPRAHDTKKTNTQNTNTTNKRTTQKHQTTKKSSKKALITQGGPHSKSSSSSSTANTHLLNKNHRLPPQLTLGQRNIGLALRRIILRAFHVHNLAVATGRGFDQLLLQGKERGGGGGRNRGNECGASKSKADFFVATLWFRFCFFSPLSSNKRHSHTQLLRRLRGGSVFF